ncbi:hypothetical protein CVT25_006381 [Psilocybe cyanescens]|uniref:T6SS Phospholipase effector Tle1-like catalytic domain-containing protein n=1 Tax=Psilocybe cyanescens TaxID=93625 RepID=A0A409XKJ5_PSICY|nr:hypothetical protein CVT25_006381 [Psilocybe cyanescens]
MEKNPTVTHTNDDDESTLKTSEDSHISCLCEPLPSGQFGRNLVVSIDGTANQFGLKNTNIVELYSHLVKDETQLTYYNSGIGTYVADSTSWSSLTQYISHQWDKAFATYIPHILAVGNFLIFLLYRNFKSKVLDAYEWLSENYRQGDRIFLFGLSFFAVLLRKFTDTGDRILSWRLPSASHRRHDRKGNYAKTTVLRLGFSIRAILSKFHSRGNRKGADKEANNRESSSKQGQENAVQRATNDYSVSIADKKNKYEDSRIPVFRNSIDSVTDNTVHHSHPTVQKDPEFKATVNSHMKKSKGGSKETPEDLCKQFKKSLSNSEVTVHFVGSWDTVSSVGVLRSECLPETTTGMTHVCAFRHALALDERRVKFLPEYANGGVGSPTKDSRSGHFPKGSVDEKASIASTNLHIGQAKPANKRKGGNIKEVWFAGSHSDVGGGNVKNLENDQFGPSLRWMTYEALIWGLRMMPFNQTWAPLKPTSSMSWIWTILENLPISRLSYTSPDGVTRRPHRKQPRRILEGQLVHESVFELMLSIPEGRSAKKPYSPIARLPEGKKWDKESLSQKNIIEIDPYIQPDRILDAIKDAVEQKKQNSDYDRLFKLSLTDNMVAIGLRSIRERPGAEDILASALESESQSQWPGKRNHVAIIAKILDRCFDLIPVEFRDDSIPSSHSSAWELLDELYPEGSSARSKFLCRFADRNTRMSLVKEEIQLYRQALENRPQPPAHIRIDFIKNLAIVLLNSLILTTLQDAGSSHRKSLRDKYKEALRFSDLSYTKRFALIRSLGSQIDEQFEEAGQESYVDERISLFKNVFDITPAEYRFEETSRQEDIDEIISFNTEILGLLSASHPHPAASTLAAILASSYLVRSKLKGRIYHIDEAIMCLQESILNLPQTDPNRADLSDVLGYSFHLRFKETGDLAYLEQANRSYHRALAIRQSVGPNEIYPLTGLAAVFCDRFKRLRQRGDLDEAIKLHRDSLLLPLRPRERATPVFDLADALLSRFKESGSQSDLDEAISLYEEALELNPLLCFQRPKCLNGLAVALRKRFEKSGTKEDLDRAISLHEEALELCPSPRLERDDSLSGLAAALMNRFTISGEQSNLYKAIDFYRQALKFLPSHHPRRADSLFGLATSLQRLYKKTSQPNNLGGALPIRKEEHKLRPSDRADSLSGLAAALLGFYIHRPPTPQDVDEEITTDHYAELDEAILLLKESLELRPLPHPSRAESLSSLVDALLTRFGDEHHELLSYRNELHDLLSPKSTVNSTVLSDPVSRSL